MRFVITAGPTREHLDPVRFLSNPSTGKMGFAIAQAAAKRGHAVTLIAGPVMLATPTGVARIDVVSARDMLRASEAALHARGKTVFVATAAVADWRPARCAKRKLKKEKMSGRLDLVRNPDILKTLHASLLREGRQDVRLVGFAAETNDLEAEAMRKCQNKGLSFIVANDVTEPGAGFGVDTNRVTLFFSDGRRKAWPLMSKRAVAGRIVRECEDLCF